MGTHNSKMDGMAVDPAPDGMAVDPDPDGMAVDPAPDQSDDHEPNRRSTYVPGLGEIEVFDDDVPPDAEQPWSVHARVGPRPTPVPCHGHCTICACPIVCRCAIQPQLYESCPWPTCTLACETMHLRACSLSSSHLASSLPVFAARYLACPVPVHVCMAGFVAAAAALTAASTYKSYPH